MNQSADLSRYDKKLEHILRTSARIFAEKSYHSTSMREISRESGVSLAGLYHYCTSKEELLFLIQDHCFGRVLERLKERLAGEKDPVAKLRILIENHLAFFAANMAEMKVLSHEADSLSGELHVHVSGKKEKYTKIARKILSEIRQGQPTTPRVDLTVATYSLFGMMNWIYNWYNPRGKVDVNDLVDNLIELFLGGFLGHERNGRQPQARTRQEPADIWRIAVRNSRMLLIFLAVLCLYQAGVQAKPRQLFAQPQKNPVLPPPLDPAKIEMLPEAQKKPRKPCFGDPVYGGNTSEVPVPEAPRIGAKAKGYPKSVNRDPAPGNLMTVFLVTFNGVKYRVFVDHENLIRQINTSDPRFKTPEGLAVGDSAEKAIAAAKQPPVNNFDCEFLVELPSGWKASFNPDSVDANGKLAMDAKVESFRVRAVRPIKP